MSPLAVLALNPRLVNGLVFTFSSLLEIFERMGLYFCKTKCGEKNSVLSWGKGRL